MAEWLVLLATTFGETRSRITHLFQVHSFKIGTERQCWLHPPEAQLRFWNANRATATKSDKEDEKFNNKQKQLAGGDQKRFRTVFYDRFVTRLEFPSGIWAGSEIGIDEGTSEKSSTTIMDYENVTISMARDSLSVVFARCIDRIWKEGSTYI